MKVFLTGATGFVGREILQELIHDDHQIVCLVRPDSCKKISDLNGDVEVCQSDAFDQNKLNEGMKDCDAVIHLIGIIREFYWKGVTFDRFHVEATNNITTAALENNIKRFILMSALGVEKNIDTKYMNTKRKLENIVKQKDFDYTIFRPSVVFGKQDQFLNIFLEMLRNPFQPFVPMVGNGNYLLQPISVNNVAQAFSRCLNEEKSIAQIYDLAGTEKYSMNQLLNLLGQSLGKEKATKLHLPIQLIKIFAFLFNQIPKFPISIDQLKMLLIGNISSDWQKAFKDFQMKPISLETYLSKINSTK